VLNKNLSNLKIENQSEVFNEKTTSFFNREDNKGKFEIIFLDPPFEENLFINELKIIKNSMIYKEKHSIIIHRQVKIEDHLDDALNVLLTKTYGRSKIIFGTF
jgi:16S rRNA G966 N2-methylase RsmD